MKSDAGNSPDAARTPLDPSRVQRVVLIRLRSIGDTVLMTPSLAALKAWRPDVNITVVSEPLAAPLLENHPLVDELILAERSLASRSALIARLRRARFDAAFNMHGGSTGAVLARFAGPARSFGYRGLSLSWLLSDRAPSPDVILRRSRIHSVEQQLALLRWSGVPCANSNAGLSLVVSPEAQAGVRERLRLTGAPGWNETGGFVCLVPGAAMESKRWDAEGFAAVADHLSERWHLPSVIVAGPGQEALAHNVASVTRSRPFVVTGLSLKELVALLGLARLFVGNDSGPMHIAAALARPIVAIWGSSDPDVWRPWTQAPCRVVQHDEARERSVKRQAGEALSLDHSRQEIKLISPAEVIAAVDEVLKLSASAEVPSVGAFSCTTSGLPAGNAAVRKVDPST